MVSLIERKKRGEPLDPRELSWICNGFLRGEIPDYQIAAWLMAVCWRGMTEGETLALTRALVRTGSTLNWDDLRRPPVDKHSTGGVGDKTSLVLVPLVAAAGVPFIKMSGRGLGHTGGTADKLESIPGLSVDLSLDAIRAQVERIGCAMVGQSPELVPGDAVLYSLRDVTGTVDSLPLIASSIMSKKLAAGAPAMVMDVKYGSGGFMKNLEAARELARQLVRIGRNEGKLITAVISSMEQPLGRAVGNSLEVREAIETLNGGGPADLWELVLELGTELLLLSGAAEGTEAARAKLSETRATGAAARKFEELIAAQHGDPRMVANPELLPHAPLVVPFRAPATGWVTRCDARATADAALALGAGRHKKNDEIDPAVGIVLHARIGTPTTEGEIIAEIHAQNEQSALAAVNSLSQAYEISLDSPPESSARYEVIRGAVDPPSHPV